jgi:trimeric autotransporter adhesin
MSAKTGTGKAALALLILTLAAGGFPEAGPTGTELKSSSPAVRKLSTLDEIAQAGKESSLDYAKARNTVASAAADVPALVKAKSSTLSAAYTVADSSSSTSATGVSVSASVPIIDQVSLDASVAKDGSTSVSAAMSPLSHADTRAQALITLAKAQASADEAGRTAGSAAVKDALTWMSLKRQLVTLEKTASLKEEAYAAAKAGNALDATNITLDDLVTALKDWSDARSALVKAQSSERSARTDLYAALGSSGGDIDVAILDEPALEAALAALETGLTGAESLGPAESYSLKAASLDVESGASSARAIWAFDPDLSLSAGVSVASGSVSPNASVKLTLSLDDLKGDKKALALASLDLARQTLARQRASDQAAYDVAVAAVQAAKINREGRKITRDQSADLAEVAAFNFKSGSYSAIDNETAAMTLASADDSYYQAIVDEYSAWLDLAKLAGK